MSRLGRAVGHIPARGDAAPRLLYAAGVKPRSIRSGLVAFAGLVLAGCGARSGAVGDAGGDTVDVRDRLSFGVVATLRPPSADAGLAAQPAGDERVHARRRSPGRPRDRGRERPGGRPARRQRRRSHVSRFEVLGRRLRWPLRGAHDRRLRRADRHGERFVVAGSATGTAQISCGDCQFAVPFAADLSGVVDVTPPLLLPSGGVGPQATTVFRALLRRRVGAAAGDGDGAPRRERPAARSTSSRRSPTAALPRSSSASRSRTSMLRYGNGYFVALDGLVDFAGNRGASNTPPAARILRDTTPRGGGRLRERDGERGRCDRHQRRSAGPLPPSTVHAQQALHRRCGRADADGRRRGRR